jgi:hypothetical protein
MNLRNPTAALLAIATLACLAEATQSTGDRHGRRDVTEDHSRGTLFISTRRDPRPEHRMTVQVFYRFGTKLLSVDCSSTYCLVVLSQTEA